MSASPSPRPDPGQAAQARLAELRPQMDAVDLSSPLPESVISGIALAQSNGDGHEVGLDMKRLMVLAAEGRIEWDEATRLVLFVD